MDNELMQLIMGLGGPKIDDFDSRISDAQKHISDSVKGSVALNDSYGNSLLSVGSDDEVEKFSKFSLSNDTLNWTLWMALYNDSWVFRRAIDKPAQDEITCGITLQNKDGTKNMDKKFEMVYTDIKRLRNDLIDLLRWGALFGGSVAAVMFDNMSDEDYKKPLNVEKVKKAKTIRMYVTDRWYGCQPSGELVTEMSDIDFGKPKSYKIVFADGKEAVFHHDYVIRYEHRTAPKLIKNGMLQGWGYAEGAHIFLELSKNDKLRTSIQSLIDKSLIEIIKMPGMRGVFMGADQENQDQLKRRLEMVNWARNYNSLTFLDKDDEYDQHTFGGLGGLSDLVSQSMWEISAALEMQGVLYGNLSQGFSSDNDALERYDETIKGRCESWVRIVYQKLLKILYAKYDIEGSIEFEFKSLLTKKQDQEKMEGVKDYAAFLTTLLNDGVIELYQYGMALKNYMEQGEILIPFDDDYIENLKKKSQEENEAFDLNEEPSMKGKLNGVQNAGIEKPSVQK